MFGLFKRKTAAPFTGEQCAVDISKDGMVINGTKLDVLVHLEAAEKLLGTPRGKKYHTSAETKEFLENIPSFSGAWIMTNEKFMENVILFFG